MLTFPVVRQASGAPVHKPFGGKLHEAHRHRYRRSKICLQNDGRVGPVVPGRPRKDIQSLGGTQGLLAKFFTHVSLTRRRHSRAALR